MHEKVLIVEDEILIRFDVADHFRAEGFQVLEAATVQAARALLQHNPDIAALFTDVRLPGAENGIDLARYVKGHHPHIKILVTSGHLPLGEVPREFGKLIDKPYIPKQVVARVRQALASRPV